MYLYVYIYIYVFMYVFVCVCACVRVNVHNGENLLNMLNDWWNYHLVASINRAGIVESMAILGTDLLEVPTIYKAYIRPM